MDVMWPEDFSSYNSLSVTVFIHALYCVSRVKFGNHILSQGAAAVT